MITEPGDEASREAVERETSERADRDLAEHFRAALEAGGLGTWRWDMASGATTWDERLEALYGLPAGGFEGSFDHYVSLLHPDDRDQVLETVRAAIESKSDYRVEHKVLWPDGSTHWVAGVGSVTVDGRGEVTGTVGCSMDITERIERELELARLASEAADAAESDRVQRDRLEFLGGINEALDRSDTVGEIMANVTASVVPRLGDWCSMYVLPEIGSVVPDHEIAHVDPTTVALARELEARFPYDPDAANGVPAVIRTGQAQFVPDITDDLYGQIAEPEVRELFERLDLRSLITVPLLKRGRVIGAMQFARVGTSRRYTDDDLALARTVAARIASSVENRRLLQQQRLVSETLQQSLLPATLPGIDGIEVAVRYWAAGEATEVGGDFYDVFALEKPGRWGVAIGDVCGTGVDAAALTGLARHTIRDSAWHGDTPTAVLASLNRSVRRSDSGRFLTCVYATLDTSAPAPTITIACGGHPPPVLVGRDGASTVGRPGTLLGVFDEVTSEARSVRLRPGELLVFYTDGATDLPPPHALDEGRFIALASESASPDRSAEAVADQIEARLEQVLPFRSRDDDIALLVLGVPERR